MRRRAFALVIVLFLVAMMATAGASLGFIAATESLICRQAADDLAHQLAIDSLLEVLPSLLERGVDPPTDADPPGGTKRYAVSVGDVAVRALLRPESAKRTVAGTDVQAITSELRQMAQEQGLNPEHIDVRPLLGDDADAEKFAPFVWFDQLVAQRDFEEVFAWTLPWAQPSEIDSADEPRKTWSDVVTFWPNASSLMVETAIDRDVRLWFLVIKVENKKVSTLHRGRM